METFEFVDTHTMGEPARIIIDGLPPILGNTMMEKKEYLRDKLDYVRKIAMEEPRGHRDMFGAILTAPTSEEAHMGVVYIDGGGYLNMCGHGSMAVATFLVEGEYVKVEEPYTNITLDTPAGLVKVKVRVEAGKTKEVSLINVPSFLYKKNLEICLENGKAINVDIAFGGSFFAIVKASELGIEVNLSHIDDIIKLGIEIREKINHKYKIEHPLNPAINQVDLVEIYGKALHPQADYRNVVVFGNGQFDRSPCGTGTCAKIATLENKGDLSLNENFVYESITGTIFRGKALERVKVGDYNAIIPEITGRSFITAKGHFLLQDEDPFSTGFSIR